MHCQGAAAGQAETVVALAGSAARMRARYRRTPRGSADVTLRGWRRASSHAATGRLVAKRAASDSHDKLQVLRSSGQLYQLIVIVATSSTY